MVSDRAVPRTGGCLCGDVRYEAFGRSELVELCHCRSCRRAVGAPVMAWAASPLDKFTVTDGSPAAYESSSGVVRTFCGRCGTSLTLADNRFPDEIYVSIASMDNPEALPPEIHIWRSHRLPWIETSDDLPRYLQFKADGIKEP